jgi:SAM-dependent methyltransferase
VDRVPAPARCAAGRASGMSAPRTAIARGSRAHGSVHAVLDVASRRRKARKILHLLDLPEGPRPLRVLEIGCGSGAIAQYLGTQAGRPLDVVAVDVEDNRLEHGGYAFVRVGDTRLPFADASFDAVITNHVIEHVGARADQLAHLREAARVLAPDGIGYLAVPNRWQVVEPHFRLPFLSWLPRGARDGYVRAARRGDRYDCEPLTWPALRALFVAAGLDARNASIAALRATLVLEPDDWRVARTVLGGVPDAALRPLVRLCPTHVCVFRRAAAAALPVHRG